MSLQCHFLIQFFDMLSPMVTPIFGDLMYIEVDMPFVSQQRRDLQSRGHGYWSPHQYWYSMSLTI